MHADVEDRAAEHAAHPCALLTQHAGDVGVSVFVEVKVQAGGLGSVDFVHEKGALWPHLFGSVEGRLSEHGIERIDSVLEAYEVTVLVQESC